tara:strand:+ start:1087 stop:1605 length:519 start_codon:yes stop_codon:yes gene_type:complete
MNKEKKQIENMTAHTVHLLLPEGDYTKKTINDEILHKLSNDFSEFMTITRHHPSKFYVIVKHYFEKRKGLHRCVKGKSLIESCLNATLVNSLTELNADLMRRALNGKKIKNDKFLKEVIKELQFALKDNLHMKAFDKFCMQRYGVDSQEGATVNDDGTLNDFKLDNHIDAKS